MKAVIRPTVPIDGRADYDGYRETKWCGPFAMAAVAGVSYKKAYSASKKGEQKRLDLEAEGAGYCKGFWKAEKVEGLALEAMKHGLALLKIHVDWNLVQHPHGPKPVYPESPVEFYSDAFYRLSEQERDKLRAKHRARVNAYYVAREAWLKDFITVKKVVEGFKRNRTYIIATTQHYMVIKNRRVIHTQSNTSEALTGCSWENNEAYAWTEVNRL